MPLTPGDEVAGRRVLGRLGGGRDGAVHRVSGPGGAGPEEALKLLEPAGAARADLAAAFRREVELTRLLAHPHVVEVLAHGETGPHGPAPGALWLTMPLARRGSATALVPGPRVRPAFPRVLAVLAQAAAALDHVHGLDVVHRDVKPANLLRDGATPAGGPEVTWLADLGSARLADDTRALPGHGRIAGSLPYAAPEVLTAQRVSPATDVYSLAATLVELLTGEPPFPRSTGFAVVQAHLRDSPPRLAARRPWLPAALDSVLARALAKDPARRYPSCGELAALVALALRGADDPPRSRPRRSWRHR